MFQLPSLPYAYDALEPTISETTLRTHHAKHHAKYVETTNALLAKRGDAPLSLEAVVRDAAATGDTASTPMIIGTRRMGLMGEIPVSVDDELRGGVHRLGAGGSGDQGSGSGIRNRVWRSAITPTEVGVNSGRSPLRGLAVPHTHFY